jgi:uncharacterized protein YkwD
MLQSPMLRRSFLQQVTFGVGLAGTHGMIASAADAEDAKTHPLLRWKTAAEVRGQPEELWRLTDLINAYRRQNGLPEAPLSPRLTAVALAHVNDLIENRPHATGNLHSWSHGEHWSGGEYRPDDKSTWPVMWDKPREIAGYDGHGFEIAAAGVDNAAHALRVWWASPNHLDVILGRGIWNKPRWRWRALGAVFQQGYACAWFGADEDVQGD